MSLIIGHPEIMFFVLIRVHYLSLLQTENERKHNPLVPFQRKKEVMTRSIRQACSIVIFSITLLLFNAFLYYYAAKRSPAVCLESSRDNTTSSEPLVIEPPQDCSGCECEYECPVQISGGTLTTLIEPSLITSARWLIGSIHRHSPDAKIAIYHYGLSFRHISEINFWHSCMVINDDRDMSNNSYEVISAQTAKRAADTFGSAIFIHPTLQVKNGRSIPELFRRLEREWNLFGSTADCRGCVLGSIRGLETDEVKMFDASSQVEPGNNSSLSSLRYTYRLPGHRAS